MSKLKKQALCIASVASNLDNFNRNNVTILQKLGYEITLAANFHSKEDINSQEKINAFAKEMRTVGVHIVHIDFARSPKKLKSQVKSIMQVRKLLKRRFDLIHCHSPICAAIVRAEANIYRRKYGTKIFYTAHGFHFYTGAPFKNWLIFYPIEKLMSRYTDVLITINKEDYKRAKYKFKAKKTVYIPGVGVDTDKFQKVQKTRKDMRCELKVNDNNIVLLSVGELNGNKNHELAIRALAWMKRRNIDISHIKYYICGIGNLKEYLEKIIDEFDLKDNVKLLGFREDVKDIYNAADIFLFMSKREGLSMALMEAMASGLPCLVSDIRGNRDLIVNGKGGYLLDSNEVDEWAKILNNKLEEILNSSMGTFNKERIALFSKKKVQGLMQKYYDNL